MSFPSDGYVPNSVTYHITRWESPGGNATESAISVTFSLGTDNVPGTTFETAIGEAIDALLGRLGDYFTGPADVSVIYSGVKQV